jgi:hypothetical protein
MTKRRLVWAAVAVCLALVVGWATWPVPQRDPVNRANIKRIRAGMTRAEVEAVLGVPPGDYTTIFDLPRSCISGRRLDGWWISNSGELFVDFSPDGLVEKTDFRPFGRSLLDRFRAWLGW